MGIFPLFYSPVVLLWDHIQQGNATLMSYQLNMGQLYYNSVKQRQMRAKTT